MFYGSFVALVTPFTATGEIDFPHLEQLLAMHLAAGTDGLVVAGSTGEAALLTAKEKHQLIAFVVKQVAGRIPVVAGTGLQSTQATVELTQAIGELGVDACLVVTPYYVKPTQAGLIAHYQAVADASSVPIVLYNVTGRTACDLLPETVAILSEHEKMIAIKEADPSMSRLQALQAVCPESFSLISGNDATVCDWLEAGAHGCISVTANVAPAAMHAMCSAVFQGDVDYARAIDQRLQALHDILFIESNPIPVKYALSAMGLIDNQLRLPLMPLSVTHQSAVQEALQSASIQQLNSMESA